MRKLFYLLSIFAPVLFAQEEVATVLQQKLNAMQTMSANFSQVVKSSNKEVSQSSGTMALQKPGLFRWATKEPMEQLVIADGKKFWIYDVDLEQVSVKTQEKEIGGAAALFLSGDNKSVSKDFIVTQRSKENQQIYDLTARSSKANFLRVILIYTKNELSGIELFDQLDQHTIVALKNVHINPKLSTKLFQFKPPKGVDVVEE